MKHVRNFVIGWLGFAAMALISAEMKCEAAPESSSPSQAKDEIVFVSGFRKEEVTPNGNLRWVREEASLRVNVPAAGKYRLTFKTITVFSATPVAITLSVSGKEAGSISADGFDLAKPSANSLEVALACGMNELTLKASRPEIPLSGSDERKAAFGLVLPIGIEAIP